MSPEAVAELNFVVSNMPLIGAVRFLHMTRPELEITTFSRIPYEAFDATVTLIPADASPAFVVASCLIPKVIA